MKIESVMKMVPVSFELTEGGTAYEVGDGYHVCEQLDNADGGAGLMQSVVVNIAGMRAMRTARGTDVELAEGRAYNMGDGIWIVVQYNESAGKTDNVVLTDRDLAAMLEVWDAVETVRAATEGLVEVAGRGTRRVRGRGRTAEFRKVLS